jgi:serine phosphatase RsbU (regulator of sigma subunit)
VAAAVCVLLAGTLAWAGAAKLADPAPFRVTLRALTSAAAARRLAVAVPALAVGGGAETAVPSPAAVMRLAGEALHRDVGRRDFVACALALLEPPTLGQSGPRLRLVNAAQVPPILCRAGQAEELEPPGDRLPLGVLPDPQYEDLALDLEPGDVVVFSTDGLPEAPALEPPGLGPAPSSFAPATEGGEMLGFERLAASAAYWAAHGAGADAVAAGIWADLTAWCGEEPHHDDMTLLVLRVPPASS